MEASLEVAYQVKRKVRQRLQTILNTLPSIKNTTKTTIIYYLFGTLTKKH